MKRIHYILSLLVVVFVCGSCKTDKANGSVFVEPVSLHITYDVFGDTKPFSTPPTVSMTNVTEQLSLQFSTDKWGKLLLDELLPGEYSININGTLSAEEASVVEGEPQAEGYNIGGFLSSVSFKLNMPLALNLPAEKQIPGKLIFKELYYCGSRTPAIGNYRNDIFYSIYNNSKNPIDLNSVYIAHVENLGSSIAPLWPGEIAGNYKNVYVQAAWKIISDNRSMMIIPGQTVVIATMAAPHNKDTKLNLNSPVDLSSADFEAYSTDPENKTLDYPTPNMKLAFWPDYAYLWRQSVFGQGMVLIEATEQEFDAFETVILPEEFWTPGESDEYWSCKKIPYSYILDAVDLIKSANETGSKRFNQPLDNGFATMSGTYLGKSVIRKINRVENGVTYYMDTNNSTQDFEINDKPLSK